MDINFLSGIILSIYLSLNPVIHRMGNAANNLCPRYKEREDSHSHFTFYCKLSKTTLDFISELISITSLLLFLPKSVSKPSNQQFLLISVMVYSQKFYQHFQECFSGIFSAAVGVLLMMMEMIKSMSFLTLSAILFLASTSSEILLLNWA